MKNKRQIIEETYGKVRGLIESKLNEQPSSQQQQTQQTQQAQQQQAQSNPERDKKIAKNIEVTMDQAMATMVKNLPKTLANFAKTSGDKDGVLDAGDVYNNNSDDQKNQQAQAQGQQIKEGNISEINFDESKFLQNMEGNLNEGGLLSLAISAPAIMKYGGKATSWIGKKMNSQWLQKWGDKAAKAGESLHHKYSGAIEKIIKPFMPNATDEQIHKAANAIFMGGVAVLFAGGLANPDVLTGVKGAELGEFSLASLQKALPTLGFS